MSSAEILADLALALLAPGLLYLITAPYRRKKEEIDEGIMRLVRPMKQDLDCLRAEEAQTSRDEDGISDLREAIRLYGLEAHDLDGRRGMDTLLHRLAGTDFESAEFYEIRTDRIWDLIGFSKGRASRRGVWVA